MVSSYRQKKLIQRFLAAVAAFLFVVSDLFFPVAVEAFVPAPVLPLIQAPLPAALTAAQAAGGATAGSALLPLVIGGLAIGAAYYFWTQSQTEQAQEIAMDKYCALYPNADVCKQPGGNWGVKVKGTSPYTGEPLYQVFIAAPAPPYKLVPYVPGSGNSTSVNNAAGDPVFNVFYYHHTIIGWCPLGPGWAAPFVNGSDGSTQCYFDKAPDWKDWPQSERDSATNLLTNSDLDPILKSNPGGSLASGQQLNDGAWVAPNETSDFQFVPGPITISAPDFDGDGEPDSTDSDDDNDSTLDLSDPDPKNPNIPAPNPNPNPSPSPSPSPNNSPPPPNPDAPPSPLPAPAPPPAVTFEPVQPAIFNGVNFVSYGIQKFSTKFPFDIFGDLPTDTPNECPTFSFFGQTQELCIIKNFLSALKWPVIIGFLVWGVLFI